MSCALCSVSSAALDPCFHTCPQCSSPLLEVSADVVVQRLSRVATHSGWMTEVVVAEERWLPVLRSAMGLEPPSEARSRVAFAIVFTKLPLMAGSTNEAPESSACEPESLRIRDHAASPQPKRHCDAVPQHSNSEVERNGRLLVMVTLMEWPALIATLPDRRNKRPRAVSAEPAVRVSIRPRRSVNYRQLHNHNVLGAVRGVAAPPPLLSGDRSL
jgi:hypothetical protein